jgi:hypothetical protein
MAKTNVGTMSCRECGKEVVVKKNENETLSYTCAWCDDSSYAKKGTGKQDNWHKHLKSFDQPAQIPTKPASAGLFV